MKSAVLVLSISLILAGCSSAIVAPSTDSLPLANLESAGTSNAWTLGSYTIAISDDHEQAELVPIRSSSLHLNVNSFVEGPPCPDCLVLGKPLVQGDGTIKLKVWLRHPFPNHPLYTGFDVRGIVVFKATDYMVTDDWGITGSMDNDIVVSMVNPKLYFSDPEKGGASLLNPDGYTFYLNPFLHHFHWDPVNWIGDPIPILNYSKGKYANGDSPNCTVNPYILFSDGSPRRMFKVKDFMQRTFHVKPPSQGAFEFGYVVQACWTQPTTTPVTNPETDFPVEANCEDPWQISAEQLKPIDYGVTEQPIFRAVIKHRPMEVISFAGIMVPTLSTSYLYTVMFKLDNVLQYWGPVSDAEYTEIIDDETTAITLRIRPSEMDNIGDELVPGHHLGILQVVLRGKGGEDGEGIYNSQYWRPVGVMPVDVYVELQDG